LPAAKPCEALEWLRGKFYTMIFILLPAYNEGKALKQLLGNIARVMVPCPYKIVLVNDGSTDETGEILRKLQVTGYGLQVITHEKNRGLGEALKSGLNYILPQLKNNDGVVTLDADNTHPPELIPLMVEKIKEGYELIIASRFCPGGKEIGLKFLRRLFSRGACWLLRLFFPYPRVNPVRNGVPLFRRKGGISNEVKDYTSGYRAYSGDLLKQATKLYGDKFVMEKGFTVMAEILIKLKKIRPKIAEIPLILRYDLKKGKSKIKIMRTIIQYFRLILKHKWKCLVPNF